MIDEKLSVDIRRRSTVFTDDDVKTSRWREIQETLVVDESFDELKLLKIELIMCEFKKFRKMIETL